MQFPLPYGRGSASELVASNRAATVRERYALLLLLVSLASCGGGKPEAPLALPASAGAWALTQEKPMSAAEYPPVLATLGIADARIANYAGPSPVTVRVFRMKSSTVAFEALQKWKPEKGVMHFYRGAYFILAETAQMKFVVEFDKASAWGRGA